MPGKGSSKQDVGVAVMDLYYPHLTLNQITDDYTYLNITSKMNIYQPKEIIVPHFQYNTSSARIYLYKILINRFHNTKIVSIPVIHFSAVIGWDLMKMYSTHDSNPNYQILKNK